MSFSTSTGLSRTVLVGFMLSFVGAEGCWGGNTPLANDEADSGGQGNSANGTAGDGTAGDSLAGSAGSDASAALPACSWPAELNPPQTTPGQCTAARVNLSCLGSNGDTESCFTDNLQPCPDPHLDVNVPNAVCHSVCKPNEYAVACGGRGGPIADPPAGCTSGVVSPGGIEYCCPCNAD
jgi:hypothetical protein